MAELAVKTAKRLLAENTSPSGSVDNDGITRALLGRGAARVAVIEKDPRFLPSLHLLAPPVWWATNTAQAILQVNSLLYFGF